MIKFYLCYIRTIIVILKLNSSDVVQPVAIINQNCDGLNEINKGNGYVHAYQ